MALKTFRPTSPGRRGMVSATFEEITKTSPEKSLLKPLKKKGGRNSRGVVTVRHRGGGAKRRLRIIDFKRNKFGVPGEVADGGAVDAFASDMQFLNNSTEWIIGELITIPPQVISPAISHTGC